MSYLRLLFLSVILLSCKKVEFDKVSSNFYSPKLALPIAYGDFKISDILNQADSIDKYIDSKSRPLLQLKINKSINGFSLTDKLPQFNTIPSQDISVYSFKNLKPVDINTINTVASGSVDSRLRILNILKTFDNNLNTNQSVDLTFSNSKDLPDKFSIKNIKFSKGKIKVNITKGLPHQTILKFTFNEITKNSIKLTDSLVYKPGNSSMEIDLASCVADFSANKLNFSIDDIILVPVAGQKISNENQIDLRVEFSEIDFDYIEGYFGEIKTDPIKEVVKIDELNNLKGTFGITNPSINIIIKNGFGIPVELDLENFNVISKVNSTPLPISFKSDKPFYFSYPIYTLDKQL